MDQKTASIQAYWDAHPLGLRYVSQQGIRQGNPGCFEHIRRGRDRGHV